jgi:Putative bacterial sensory transduction regulator
MLSAAAIIESTLDDRGVEWDRTGPQSFVATLPGTHKLKTLCNLIVGDHAVRIEAFVMRQPQENREELWSWLLQRNARMYGVAFCIDSVGDVYLVGRIALHAITPEEVDRLLGAVLTYADESFDSMLEIGFGSAIRREWAWRRSRGESLENLRAFAHFAAPSPGGTLPE